MQQKQIAHFIILRVLIGGMVSIMLPVSGCKKFITVGPPANQIISTVVFTSDATATAAVTGIYSQMMNTGSQFSAAYTTLYAGMAADELKNYSSGTNDEFTNNQLSLANHGLLNSAFWQPAYKFIYSANLAIEQLNASTQLTPATKLQLLGEAKFIRAFCYFNLVNLFGDVPLITSSDYQKNITLPRSPVTEVYTLIKQDLAEAAQSLPAAYAGTGRVRPNKWAAMALLARTALYNQQWGDALTASGAVINAGLYKLENNTDSVFLSGSAEAIWQLQPVNPSFNTWEGNILQPSSINSTPTFFIRDTLLNSFETGDKRKASWLSSRMFSGQTVWYPNKYKKYNNTGGITEYYMVLRLAEQFLIRAEAYILQGKITEGITDINIIRQRSGLSPLGIVSKDDALKAVAQERKIELFAEWGHRWMDLKRTNTADALLKILKPATWQSSDQLWPIPNDQLKANPSLQQNPGY